MDGCNHLSTALLAAAEDGHEHCVKQLIQAGADVNTPDESGETPLIKAIKPEYKASKPSGQYEQCVDLLLKALADVNCPDKYGTTALIHALKLGNQRIVRSLIEALADVNTSDSFGYTALIHAAERCFSECLDILIEAGADVNFKPNGDDDDTEETEQPESESNQFKNKETALMAVMKKKECMSAKSKEHSCVTMLIKAGADVNATNLDNMTPLVYATMMGNPNTVHALLEAGADINAVTGDGKSALMCAAENHHCLIVEYLVKMGATVNVVSDTGQTALIYAARVGDEHCVKLLIKSGADVNMRQVEICDDDDDDSDDDGDDDGTEDDEDDGDSNDEENAALIAAIRNKHYACAVLLLNAGADVNVRDSAGSTALIRHIHNVIDTSYNFRTPWSTHISLNKDGNLAPWNQPLEVFDPCKFTMQLLEKGADVNAKDASNCTALMTAAELAFPRCIKILLEAGADVNGVCCRGETALFKAAKMIAHEDYKSFIKQWTGTGSLAPRGESAEPPVIRKFYHTCLVAMMNAGADVNIITNSGCSVLEPLLRSNNTDYIRLVLKAGIEVNRKDALDQTALESYMANSTPIRREIVHLAMVAGEGVYKRTVKKKDQENRIIHVKVPDHFFRKVVIIDLDSMCRDAIRGYLTDLKPHVNLFCKIPQLPLPKPLKDYLLYDRYNVVEDL